MMCERGPDPNNGVFCIAIISHKSLSKDSCIQLLFPLLIVEDRNIKSRIQNSCKINEERHLQ